MPDLEGALDELRRLADRPVGEPKPVATVMARAGRRRRRRRTVLALAGVVGLTAVVGAGAGRLVEESEVSRVATQGPVESPGLRVDPNASLDADEAVVVTGPFDVDEVAAAGQCASEARQVANPRPWCDFTVPDRERPTGEGLEVTVRRWIDTPNGRIGCAESPGRCVVGVRTRSEYLLAPISFDQRAPAPEPALQLGAGPVTEGAAVAVVGTGFAPGVSVILTQCVATPPLADLELFDTAVGRCDGARVRTATADSAGRFEVDFLAYSEVLTYDGWLRCEPCAIRTGLSPGEAALVPIDVVASESPMRPSVRIEDDPPHDPGQRVALIGDGFQALDDRIEIYWCAIPLADVEAGIVERPRDTNPPCAVPSEGYSLSSDELGRLRIASFPLPEAPFGAGGAGDCSAPEVACALAWTPGEGSPPAFVTLFELR